jgi:hypothetical protein
MACAEAPAPENSYATTAAAAQNPVSVADAAQLLAEAFATHDEGNADRPTLHGLAVRGDCVTFMLYGTPYVLARDDTR